MNNDQQPNTVDETPTDPWVNMLIGRQWEIYWEHNNDYEDDWYDAVCYSLFTFKLTWRL